MDAQKGLIVNSRHLCLKPRDNRARANLGAQNGRVHRTRPVVWAVECLRRAKRARAVRIARMRARGMALGRAAAAGRAER